MKKIGIFCLFALAACAPDPTPQTSQTHTLATRDGIESFHVERIDDSADFFQFKYCTRKVNDEKEITETCDILGKVEGETEGESLSGVFSKGDLYVILDKFNQDAIKADEDAKNEFIWFFAIVVLQIIEPNIGKFKLIQQLKSLLGRAKYIIPLQRVPRIYINRFSVGLLKEELQDAVTHSHGDSPLQYAHRWRLRKIKDSFETLLIEYQRGNWFEVESEK